ncbi:chromosome segregation protein Spc25-domain-containing protein [Mycena epipterygia]|nr:chromosome segregation protein Spc25-domain-containing protein [Mycena epipterygia]
MAHIIRVPQIDLSTVLADQSPHIDLRFESYETSTRNFLKAVANYKTRTVATISDKRAAQATEKKRALERIGNIQAETNHCKTYEIQLVSDLQREQEERQGVELGVSAFKRQLATLRDRCAAIDTQIEHYRAIAANLEREKMKEREYLGSLAARNSSEVASLEARLSCVVEGVDEDQLLVRMSKIHPSDPSREFTFVLDVSGASYKVLTSSPSLPTLPLLVGQLRDSKDLFAFVLDVRRAYVDLAMHTLCAYLCAYHALIPITNTMVIHRVVHLSLKAMSTPTIRSNHGCFPTERVPGPRDAPQIDRRVDDTNPRPCDTLGLPRGR